MKQLYDYIVEKAIGNLGISFDEFCDYVDGGAETRRKIRGTLRKKFGSKLESKLDAVLTDMTDVFLVEMSRMKVEIDENILRFLYNQICSTPESKIKKFVGAGAEGVAFVIGDKIIKCFYNNKIPKYKLDFYELCKSGKYDVLPHIYRIGKGYVIMEKLEVRSKKCLDIYHTLLKDAGEDTLYHLIQDNKLDGVNLNTKQQQAVSFMHAIREPLDELGFNPTNYGDLGSDNLGERADGTVVYFDI